MKAKAKRKARTKPYTADEYRRFKRLVEKAESRVQLDRIMARFEQEAFIKEVGKEKCDIMFARLCGKEPPHAN